MTRLTHLDGLRGWLSLMVVVSHVAALRWVPTVPAPDPLTALGFHLGAPAVDAFFVLSGLVVSLSLTQRPRPYGVYLRWRAWRLLPLGILGLLLAPVVRWCASHLTGDSLLIFSLREPLSRHDWRGIFTAGLLPFTANHLNPPLWSLIVEQHMAFLMPALIWTVKRGMVAAGAVATVCLLLALGHDTLYSLWFVPAFMLGIAIRSVHLPPRFAWLLIVPGFVIWQHRLLTGDDPLFRQTAIFGAALLIVGLGSLKESSAVRAFFCSPLSQWLGKISFSLYVTHFVVLMLGASLTPARPEWGAALSLPFTLLFAALVWRYIESPVLAFGQSRRSTLRREQRVPPATL